MSENLSRTKSRLRAGGRDLTLHRAIEILLAHRCGAAIRDIDPTLDREQVLAVADLAAYYFGEPERGCSLQVLGRTAAGRANTR
ncbi:MAG TPA: hypothetical protein VFL97_10690 [Nitrococcus sp.]|nr:hypothetical protein [Nitrococcus sp.]